MRIVLSHRIDGAGFLPFLSSLSHIPEGENVELDFEHLRRVSPGALVTLTATVTRWLRERKKVTFLNLDRCSITGYLQRMDFLSSCGIDAPESFTRHQSRGRFVPVRLVDHDVDGMGHELASCLAPGGEQFDHPQADLYDLAWYVFTETANNTRQHSMGLGYAAAQVAREEGLVRMAIADNGRGILQSFLDTEAVWATSLSSHEDAILKALEPKVSSRGQPTNEGVGMTLVTELVKMTSGWQTIVSGAGAVHLEPGKTPQPLKLRPGTFYQGTLVICAFEQEKVADFPHLLEQAKLSSGLLRPNICQGNFQ